MQPSSYRILFRESVKSSHCFFAADCRLDLDMKWSEQEKTNEEARVEKLLVRVKVDIDGRTFIFDKNQTF